jgi:3-oxoacyl-[acyl-carrier-protein] synthase-1
MEIYVTSYSMISAIGFDSQASLSDLKAYKSGIKQTAFNDKINCQLGQIPYSNEELMDKFGVNRKLSRTALLGIGGVQSVLSHINMPKERVGFINGTSVGGIDFTEETYFEFLDGKTIDFNRFKNHPNGTVTNEIVNSIGPFDFVNTISTACSSAANAVLQGARLIRSGVLDFVIVGGTDSLSSFTINGFKSLMIYDENHCKPFDKDRGGINLGEGSGYLVLESEASMNRTKNKPLAKLSGWCNSADAYHQTASSPDGNGAIASMKGALEMSGLQPNQIDYINAHGTATNNNDLTELTAIKTVFGDTIPDFSSTKAYTGHTLAACGGIESSFSILALERGLIYPNLNFNSPIEELNLSPNVTFKENVSVNHILSNSFGFGGNNTTLIYSKI